MQEHLRPPFNPESIPDAPRPPFTYETLTAYSSLSVPTLRRLVAAGLIPHAKVGRRVLFPAAAIEAWLADKAEASLRPAPATPADTVRRRRRIAQPYSTASQASRRGGVA